MTASHSARKEWLAHGESAQGAFATSIDAELVSAILGHLSVCDQVEVMHDAMLMIAVHGADLTNMIFLPASAAVLELGVECELEGSGVDSAHWRGPGTLMNNSVRDHASHLWFKQQEEGLCPQPGQTLDPDEWLLGYPISQFAKLARQANLLYTAIMNCRAAKWILLSSRLQKGIEPGAVSPTMSATEVKLFGKWTYEDVMLSDLSLVDYIAVNKAAQSFLPHTQGRYQMRRFRKALCPIVERLCCSIMMHGRNNGKKLMAVRIVKHAFEIIHLLTDKNPIQVFVDAVKNGGPREDSTRVGSAGVVRRQAVDVSPLRRVNQAIYLICTGARNSAFRNIKSISECLADEIMNAAKESSNSYAIKKKDEIERVAKEAKVRKTYRALASTKELESLREQTPGKAFDRTWCNGDDKKQPWVEVEPAETMIPTLWVIYDEYLRQLLPPPLEADGAGQANRSWAIDLDNSIMSSGSGSRKTGAQRTCLSHTIPEPLAMQLSSPPMYFNQACYQPHMIMTWASDVPPLHSWTTALESDALLVRAFTV
ncbi:40S ribosomal protein S5-2 [Symbiodinium microadriaticum]|uniref:40S ribosomal protein S5-2 n=1 Tax=Symbiodinium microadriaticum TaxID=2951 RepID=A0A1Q9D3X8_SYMMI|nr:40S ribosomal protein S5-2 [Symbiodinium microadriaticum]